MPCLTLICSTASRSEPQHFQPILNSIRILQNKAVKLLAGIHRDTLVPVVIRR